MRPPLLTEPIVGVLPLPHDDDCCLPLSEGLQVGVFDIRAQVRAPTVAAALARAARQLRGDQRPALLADLLHHLDEDGVLLRKREAAESAARVCAQSAELILLHLLRRFRATKTTDPHTCLNTSSQHFATAFKGRQLLCSKAASATESDRTNAHFWGPWQPGLMPFNRGLPHLRCELLLLLVVQAAMAWGVSRPVAPAHALYVRVV